MASTYADWRGHVIVCGLRGLGLRIVEQLSLSGVPAVVVDDDPDVRMARILRDWDVPRIAASPRVAESLAGAGLAGALAVICVLGDDLSTLETALLSQQLRPEVRVVVELENPAVGRALAQVGVAVLDVAGLSAPSVVEACLGGDSQELSLSGEPYIAIRTTAARPGTLRELFGALPPIAVIPATGGDVVICPGRDEPVAAGDEVTLIGTPEELRVIGLTGRPIGAKPPVTARTTRRMRSVRHLAMSVVHAGDRRLAIAMAALITVVIVSTAALHLAYRLAGLGHLPLLDSLYFTIETVTTVGYGDFTFRGQTPWLMASAICLMIAGAVFVAVFFALLTNVVVGRRIEESLGHERITGLNGHVLVIGLGSIGLRVVQQLAAAGQDIVIVERDEHNRHLGQARDLGIPVVIADATLPSVLESVRLASASAVAIMTSDDLANLETGLAVRDQLGPRWETTAVVLRIFDQRFARSVKHTFGFTTVRSTAALAAPWFVGAALGLDVLNTFYAGDELLLVARLTVTPGGGLQGVAMSELGARTRVLAIRRATDPLLLDHLPRRTTRFRPDDQAYLIGPYSELLTVLRRDRPAPQQQPAVTVKRVWTEADEAEQPAR